jgi:hypothetical protein
LSNKIREVNSTQETRTTHGIVFSIVYSPLPSFPRTPFLRPKDKAVQIRRSAAQERCSTSLNSGEQAFHFSSRTSCFWHRKSRNITDLMRNLTAMPGLLLPNCERKSRNTTILYCSIISLDCERKSRNTTILSHGMPGLLLLDCERKSRNITILFHKMLMIILKLFVHFSIFWTIYFTLLLLRCL